MRENIEPMTDVERQNRQRRIDTLYRRFNEMILWFLFAGVIGFRALSALGMPNDSVIRYSNEVNFFRIRAWVLNYYFDLILSILVLIFPILFNLVFGVFPIESIRAKVSDRKMNKSLLQTNGFDAGKDNFDTEKRELGNLRDKILGEIEELKILRDPPLKSLQKEIDVLAGYLVKSDKISNSIFSRANSYLFIGSFIALIGVLFFYFQSVDIAAELSKAKTAMNNSLLLLEILPRVGVLIFVESIAFFFLRLYRRNMEEFRYYDALTRQRENQYAIFKLAEEHKGNIDLFEKLINLCAFNANPNKIAQGETNSIIEIEKAIGKDSEIFDKLIELVKLTKK
jgi:hypothetical protein